MSSNHRQGGFAAALAALLVLALLLAGCGGSDDSDDGGSSGGGEGGAGVAQAEDFGSEVSGSQAKQAEAPLLGYTKARANGEWSKACSYLAKDLLQVYEKFSKNLKVNGCPGFTKVTSERLTPEKRDALAEVEVESVRLEGNGGFVIYTDGNGTQSAKPVVKEDGTWKLSSLLARAIQRNSKK